MYAFLVQGGTTSSQRDEMNRAVTELLIPALVSAPGFRGALNLEDRATGHGMMLTFWDTQEQAMQPPNGPEFRDALSAIMRISTGERAPVSFWHVNALQFDAQALRQTTKQVESI